MKTAQSLIISLCLFAIVACQSDDHSSTTEIHYGPMDLSYELPIVEGTIYYVAPDGKAESDGLSLNSPTTIEAAIAWVETNDAIVMRGGTYRTGNLTFNQSITIQPYLDEKPVLKGTLVATDWHKVKEGIWYTPWLYLFPEVPEPWWRRDREEKHTPLHRFNNDGIFVDGSYLQSVGSKDEVDADTYYVDYDAKRIYLGVDPTDKHIEITAFRKAIFRTTAEVHGKVSDGKGPIIRGLEITQYPDTMVHIDGYYPQGISSEEEHGKDVVGTVFENCTFSNSFRIGVFAIGDSMVMRNCKIVDTNTEGLYIVASSDVLLERNIFAHNNIERWTGFYPAAVKIFNQTYRVVCRENLVTNQPYSNGIWYDVGNVDGVFLNNWIEDVGKVDKHFREDQVWPSSNGFFFEISQGAICAGNVFVNCDQGVLILNSSNVEIYNNTFINSIASYGRNDRGDNPDHFGWHPTTGPGVEERDGHVFKNNLFAMDEGFNRPMLFAWQSENICQRLTEPHFKALDYNYYVRRDADNENSMVLWSPYDNEECQTKIYLPEELNELYPSFSANSKYIKGFEHPLFANYEDEDFRLSAEFAEISKGTTIPKNIAKFLELSDEADKFIGAFPVE